MMEQEKKEFKKLREREKEKERDRERDREREREREWDRAAMEKMAMERRRHEGDYRVIFREGIHTLTSPTSHKSLFPLREGNRRFREQRISVAFAATLGGRGPAQDSRRVRAPEEPQQACQVGRSARVRSGPPDRKREPQPLLSFLSSSPSGLLSPGCTTTRM